MPLAERLFPLPPQRKGTTLLLLASEEGDLGRKKKGEPELQAPSERREVHVNECGHAVVVGEKLLACERPREHGGDHRRDLVCWRHDDPAEYPEATTPEECARYAALHEKHAAYWRSEQARLATDDKLLVCGKCDSFVSSYDHANGCPKERRPRELVAAAEKLLVAAQFHDMNNEPGEPCGTRFDSACRDLSAAIAQVRRLSAVGREGG